jgi:hypothetical protein
MEIKLRTFEALKYPKGSAERVKLNLNSITSEYLPSYPYCIAYNGASNGIYKTKADAMDALAIKDAFAAATGAKS